MKGGTSVIAFVDDPTGYKWELIERKGANPEPIAQVHPPPFPFNRWFLLIPCQLLPAQFLGAGLEDPCLVGFMTIRRIMCVVV